ncbi:MAG: dodecin family protein [Vicinamibacterales bacterium]
MAIHKVIEVIAQSEASWEDAARLAVQEASASVKNIKSIWIKDTEGVVRDGTITAFRVTARITFEVGA